VLATGETTRVRDFVTCAFAEVGVPIEWRGEAEDETGVDARTGRVIVRVDPRYFRPTEVDLLIGDPRKARENLGWSHKTTWRQLCAEMVREDLVKVVKEGRGDGDR